MQTLLFITVSIKHQNKSMSIYMSVHFSFLHTLVYEIEISAENREKENNLSETS